MSRSIYEVVEGVAVPVDIAIDQPIFNSTNHAGKRCDHLGVFKWRQNLIDEIAPMHSIVSSHHGYELATGGLHAYGYSGFCLVMRIVNDACTCETRNLSRCVGRSSVHHHDLVLVA